MRAYKLEVNVPSDHRLAVELPADFPPGPAEVIVLSAGRGGRGVIKLAGVLGGSSGDALRGDPVEDALRELRDERAGRLETFDAGPSAEKT
jgi:hypothetical protein